MGEGDGLLGEEIGEGIGVSVFVKVFDMWLVEEVGWEGGWGGRDVDDIVGRRDNVLMVLE